MKRLGNLYDKIYDMEHAIGLKKHLIIDGEYRIWRNFAGYSRSVESWEELVEHGYATKREVGTPFNEIVYSVTDAGIKIVKQKHNPWCI